MTTLDRLPKRDLVSIILDRAREELGPEATEEQVLARIQSWAVRACRPVPILSLPRNDNE